MGKGFFDLPTREKKKKKETGVFVRHVVEYENGSFLTARQGSVPFRLPEPGCLWAPAVAGAILSALTDLAR